MANPTNVSGSPDESGPDEEDFEGPDVGFIVTVIIALLFLEEILCCGGFLVANYALGK